MGMEALTLVANPGSASRKYALFRGDQVVLRMHVEYENGRVVCGLETSEKQWRMDLPIADIREAARSVLPFLQEYQVLDENQRIERIGLRVVAPTGYFLQDHVMDSSVVGHLEAARARAPLHIQATLEEFYALHDSFAEALIVGVSDSAFHITKPDYAWNYGLPLADADYFEIKRFGYHGLSVASVVRALESKGKLPRKLIVCHLGSGASVTALNHGKSVDTTMGYSPLEGLVMGTRVGTIDATAVQLVRSSLGLDDAGLEHYLNERSGLLGLSGSSSDIRELLAREKDGDYFAGLALQTYIHSAQKAVGQMGAVLGGVDMIVFTGTVGERSAVIRERILKAFHYLDFQLDEHANGGATAAKEPACISKLTHSRPIYVVPADEGGEIVRRAWVV